jgi:hypothetical protein
MELLQLDQYLIIVSRSIVHVKLWRKDDCAKGTFPYLVVTGTALDCFTSKCSSRTEKKNLLKVHFGHIKQPVMGKFTARKPQKPKAASKKKEPETFEECMEGKSQPAQLSLTSN